MTFDQQLKEIPVRLERFQDELRHNASTFLSQHIVSPKTRNKFVEHLQAQDGFIRAPWCGSTDCEKEIKQHTSAKICNIPNDERHGEKSCIWCGQKGLFFAHFSKAY